MIAGKFEEEASMPDDAGPMVMTILDARVPEDRWDGLRAAYAETTGEAEITPGLVATFLVQAVADREAWRIMTLWESRASLDAMRAAGPPRGPAIFRGVGAEPTLTIHEVAGRLLPSPGGRSA